MTSILLVCKYLTDQNDLYRTSSLRVCLLQGVNIAFYDDSITKLWRDGTPANNGMSDVYAQYFGSHSAAVLGVGGITKVGSAKNSCLASASDLSWPCFFTVVSLQ